MEETQNFSNDDGSRYTIEQLRKRMDAAETQREQAIEKQANSYEKAIELQRLNYEERVLQVERLLSEKIRAGDSELLTRIDSIKDAGDKLASERDRAASTLRDAHQKAIEQAESERAKAAQRLAEQITQQIQSGDENLKLHILAQEQEIQAVRRETSLIHEASEKAIQKAEAATEKRFGTVNGVREQLIDQARDFMPRELADSQFSDMRKEINILRASNDTAVGKSQGSTATLGYLIAAATIAISIIVIIVNVVLAA